MKKIGSDYQNLVEETPTNNQVVSSKVDFKLVTQNREKIMSNSSRLALPWISVITTLAILGSSSEALALQLKRGDNNSQVRNVQSCLRRLGYFNGPVNGNFGSITENAVRRFQQASGISAIGKVGPQTQAALQRRCGRGNRPRTVNCQSGLRSGCDGAAVRRLQQNLKRLRYYNGPVTGRFRQLTREAVIKFQRAYGINPIGVVGPQTRRALNSALNRQTPRPQPAVAPPPVSTPPRRFCDHNREIIGLGCEGEWVRRMQQRLRDLGYFQANPTGYFGNITQQAVINFQRNNRLSPTGSVDSITWGRMNQVPPQSPPPPQPTGFLRAGSRGPQVTNLQQNLKQLGYFYGNPTGFYDRSTQDAVLRFQQSYGLPMTGNVDSRTSQIIFDESRRIRQGGMGGGSDFEPIYPNDNNPRVEKLQKRLSELGLLKANPTGYFGPFTREGVLAFQRYHGLSETGFVNEETWEKLGFSVSREKRYVIVIPLRNSDTYNQVLQYIPSARIGKSRLGDFVNAGEYNQRNQAQSQSQFLRDRGFDARVEYF